jgi:hypothetical protein
MALGILSLIVIVIVHHYHPSFMGGDGDYFWEEPE